MLSYFFHKFKSLRDLLMPYKYSFIVGHSYFTNDQIVQIKNVLESTGQQQSVNDVYEMKFSALIGTGQSISFAAGRMAFYVLMRALGIGKGDEVILPGFTCSVMANAILRLGAIPIFANIDPETFGSSAKETEKKITNKTKLIVAQHSFGIPCKIDEIVELGKREGVFVLEDSTLALDSSLKGIKVGDWGNAAIFSMEHSKPLNTLIGGVLYTRDKTLFNKIKGISASLPDLDKDHQYRLYSQFLFERKYYVPTKYRCSFFTNIVRAVFNKLRSGKKRAIYLYEDFSRNTSGAQSYPYPAKLPSFLAQIGLFELERWPKEREQRQKILKQYIEILENSKMAAYLPTVYNDKDLKIIPFRFVFTHPDAGRIKRMMSKNIFTDQILFNAPIVCCPDGPESLGYRSGECQSSERVCSEIVNWPCILPEGFHPDILNIFSRVVNC